MDRAPGEPGDAGREVTGARSRLPAPLLVQAAGVIASGLRSTCLETGGEVRWVTARQPDDGADLYGGALGIALFLAAYARIEGSAWARDLALRAVGPARRAATGYDDANEVALGGLVGRGGQIYALAALGRLLDESALLTEANRLATRIEPRWIEADRSLDVVHGSAGLILALLSLGPAVGEPGPGRRAPIALVRAASAHLVAMQQPPGAPWPGAVIGRSDALPQSGFAHGATGIAVALARAGQALGDDALFAAAARALAFERAHCAAEPGRWRMAPGDPRTPSGWCRGGPGAALGRSAVLEASRGQLDDADAAMREVAEALAVMQLFPPMPLDHLCCGGLSVVDALLALSRADGAEAVLAAAHARAVWILRAARTRGHFVTGRADATEPSLFQGLAGVGYGLLRLIDPESVPCVSMLASPTDRSSES